MKSAIFLALLFPFLAAAAPKVEFAVLEQMGTRVKRVVVQGDRSDNKDSLAAACAEKSCSCQIFFEEGVLELPALRVSPEWNTVSCRALEGMDPASISHVKVKGPGFDTPKFLVKRSLSLREVLGAAEGKKIRRIYRYSCDRTFFEGEGVTSHGVSCVAHQRLGLLRAKYDFYLYASALESNFREKAGDEAFPDPICGFSGTLQWSCTATVPVLEYGVYADRTNLFSTAVHLPARPGGDSSLYGFVALPDAFGDCPTGLVSAAPFMAEPSSIGYGRYGSLPSNFVNSQGTLNNVVVSTRAPEDFVVAREANSVTCDSQGDCTFAEFQEPKLAQRVSYTRLTPTVCVIPRHLVLGL